MRSFLFVVLLSFHAVVFGQKQTTEIFEAEEIQRITISSDEVFNIKISAAPVSVITIRTKADGEYYNDIRLESEIKGGTLKLTTMFREILQSGFDKLSAHKVFAMDVEIEIPEGLSVEIISNVASVEGSGEFENLLVQLKSGSCFLNEFLGNAVINTYNGNIEVYTSSAIVEASSRNGSVTIPFENHGRHRIHITSINGNINVQKTK